jgi:hypothetical protein
VCDLALSDLARARCYCREVTIAQFGVGRATTTPASDEYRPGVCNIGPEEIARRRRAGHLGAVATLIVLAILVAIHAPPFARLLLVLPAAGAATGYLQAWLKFCAGFGSAGVFNFGPLGGTLKVVTAEARRRDRVRSLQIVLGALAIGLAVGVVAAAAPV